MQTKRLNGNPNQMQISIPTIHNPQSNQSLISTSEATNVKVYLPTTLRHPQQRPKTSIKHNAHSKAS
eukprot:gene3108-2090_t